MASFAQQVKMDFNNAVRSVGRAFSGASKPRGAPVSMKKSTLRSRKSAALQKSFHERMMRSNEKDDRRNRAPAGPTPEQQVASDRAAEKEAKIKKGKARRKKYEAAQTMAKKMKLIFVD
jgi:hypothetical protein